MIPLRVQSAAKQDVIIPNITENAIDNVFALIDRHKGEVLLVFFVGIATNGMVYLHISRIETRQIIVSVMMLKIQ